MGNVLSIRSREEIPNIATIALTLGFIGVCAAGAISGTSAAITTGLVVIIGTFLVDGVVYYIWKPRSTNELGNEMTMMERQQNTEVHDEEEGVRAGVGVEEGVRAGVGVEEGVGAGVGVEAGVGAGVGVEAGVGAGVEVEKDRIFHETMKQIQDLGNRLDSFTGENSVIGQLNQFKLRLQNEVKKMNENVNYRKQAIRKMKKILKEAELMKSKSLKIEDVLKLMKKNNKFDKKITSLSRQVMQEMRANSPYFTELMKEIEILRSKNSNLRKEFLKMLNELDELNSQRIEPLITHKPLTHTHHTHWSENQDFL